MTSSKCVADANILIDLHRGALLDYVGWVMLLSAKEASDDVDKSTDK